METSCRVGGAPPPGRGLGVLGISASSLTDCVFERVYPSHLSAFQISLSGPSLHPCLCLSLDICLWVSVSLVGHLCGSLCLFFPVSQLYASPCLCLSLGFMSLCLVLPLGLCLSLGSHVSVCLLGPLSLDLCLFFYLWVPAFSGSYSRVRIVRVSVGLCLSGLIYLQS